MTAERYEQLFQYSINWAIDQLTLSTTVWCFLQLIKKSLDIFKFHMWASIASITWKKPQLINSLDQKIFRKDKTAQKSESQAANINY